MVDVVVALAGVLMLVVVEVVVLVKHQWLTQHLLVEHLVKLICAVQVVVALKVVLVVILQKTAMLILFIKMQEALG
jgi:hypothetical protein